MSCLNLPSEEESKVWPSEPCHMWILNKYKFPEILSFLVLISLGLITVSCHHHPVSHWSMQCLLWLLSNTSDCGIQAACMLLCWISFFKLNFNIPLLFLPCSVLNWSQESMGLIFYLHFFLTHKNRNIQRWKVKGRFMSLLPEVILPTTSSAYTTLWEIQSYCFKIFFHK